LSQKLFKIVVQISFL